MGVLLAVSLLCLPWLLAGQSQFDETRSRRTEIVWPTTLDDRGSRQHAGGTAFRRTDVIWEQASNTDNEPNVVDNQVRAKRTVDEKVDVHQPRKHFRACYFTNWAQYRPGKGKYVPEDYIPGLCTHMLFAFGWVNEDFTVRAFDPADEDMHGQKGMFSRVNALKLRDRDLQTLLSFGGWTFGTRLFKALSKTAATRKVFIDSSIEFVRARGFDGIDIDWEYPVGDEDKQLYSKLIKETRQAIEKEARQSGLPTLLLSAAVSAGEGTIKQAYDIPEIAKHFDFVLLMAYDFHGGWETITGIHSPLFPREDEIEWQKVWNVDWAANYWAEQGMPKSKIVVGIGLYGRGWTLRNPQTDNGLSAETTGPAKKTTYVREAGVSSYYELCEVAAKSTSKRVWHPEHQVPYLVDGDQWFGYDDKESVKNKMQWLRKNGYGGAFVWTLDFDDFGGHCPGGGSQKYPLINLIKNELDSTGVVQPPPVVVTQPPPKKTTAAPPVVTDPPTTPQATTADSTVAPLTTEVVTKDPSPTTEATTVAPTPAPTILPPTTPSPGPTGACDGRKNGFHPSPGDCDAFILCLDNELYTLTCPTGLEFNSKKKHCTLPKDSECKKDEPTEPGGNGGPTPRPNAFVCNSDGFFRDPSDCSTFYRCIFGVPYRFSCAGTLFFNPDINTCDFTFNVECEV